MQTTGGHSGIVFLHAVVSDPSWVFFFLGFQGVFFGFSASAAPSFGPGVALAFLILDSEKSRSFMKATLLLSRKPPPIC